MALTPVQNLKFTSVRIIQETIDFNEKKDAKSQTVTQEITKAKESASPLNGAQKSNYEKIRDKIAGATVFDGGRMTKEELKIKVLMETGKELGIDLEKEGADLKKLGRLIVERFDNMKMYNPKLYDKTIASLNKELGLNLLGLSVIDFAKAAADDKSDIAHELERKLDEIFDMKNQKNTNLVDDLQKHLGKLQEENAKEEKTGDDGQGPQQAAVVTDKETGTYKPAKRGATMK